MAGQRARHPFGAGLEGQRRQVDLHEASRLLARLGARQRQQLIREPHRAIGGGAQLVHGAQGLLGVARHGGLLGMQLHRGQRRAQLVRGIGDELALRVERGLQAPEQRVHGAGEGPDLERHLGLVDRLQRGMSLPVQRIGQMRERPELLVHHAPDDAPAGQQQQQQRHHDRHQEFGGDLVAVPHRLGHLDDHRIAAVGLLHAHLRDAHGLPLVVGLEHIGVMHAAHAGALQRQPRVAGQLVLAVADAVDQLLGGIGEHRLRQRRHRERRVGPGDLDLLGDRGGEIGQRTVDHVLRVLPGQPVGDQAAHQREHRQRGGEAAQQRAAQAGSGRFSGHRVNHPKSSARHEPGAAGIRKRGMARGLPRWRRGGGAASSPAREGPTSTRRARPQTLAGWRISCSR